jgi:hypothetical protein
MTPNNWHLFLYKWFKETTIDEGLAHSNSGIRDLKLDNILFLNVSGRQFNFSSFCKLKT